MAIWQAPPWRVQFRGKITRKSPRLWLDDEKEWVWLSLNEMCWEPEDSVASRKHDGRVAPTYWLDRAELGWDMEAARGQRDLEKARRSCCSNLLTRHGWVWMRCGRSQRTVWPQESTAVVLLQPIDQTGLRLNAMCWEPEDSVASRKHDGRVAPTYWLDRAELGWDVEGARGQCGR